MDVDGIKWKIRWSLLEGNMQVKKEETYDRILAISEKLFIKYGYEKTPIHLIAEKCYVSKSNIYRYFASKEDIYETIVAEPRTKILMVANRVSEPDFIRLDLKDKIEEVADVLSDVLSENRGGILVMLKSSTGRDKNLISNQIIRLFMERACIEDEKCKELIAKLILFGLTEIVSGCEGREEVNKQVKLFMKYHYEGLQGFIDLGRGRER